MKRIITLCLALLVAPQIGANDSRSSQPEFPKIFRDGMRDGFEQLMNQRIGGIKSEPAKKKPDRPTRIIGWRKERVEGRPLADCLMPADRGEINDRVLRCHHGYERRVPITAP